MEAHLSWWLEHPTCFLFFGVAVYLVSQNVWSLYETPEGMPLRTGHLDGTMWGSAAG